MVQGAEPRQACQLSRSDLLVQNAFGAMARGVQGPGIRFPGDSPRLAALKLLIDFFCRDEWTRS